MTEKVFNVQEIELTIHKTNPPNLVIEAQGEVTTSDWRNGHLRPYVYAHQPNDGIYEFEFVADRPEGPVLEVITPITAQPFYYKDFPQDLVGVRIFASQNSKTKKLQ